MSRRLVVPVFGLAAAGFAAGVGLGAGGSAVKLNAKLDARHEVPASKGAARASGAFTASLSGRSLTWKLTFVHLSGKAAAAHVHLGRAGVSGPVAVPLCGPCASGAHGKVMISSKARAALLARSAYVNVHTARNPAGEIRGQIAGGGGPGPAPTTDSTTTQTTDDSGGGGYGGGYG
jgi:hypothetical protein